MKAAFSHSKHCFTCGKQKPRKELGYDLSTLKTYCNDNPACYKGDLLPLEGDTIREALYANYDREFVDSLDRMLGKPLSTRLQPYLAMHVLKVAEANELTSFNEALLFILNDHFNREELTDFTLPEWKEYPTEVCEDCEEPEETIIKPEEREMLDAYKTIEEAFAPEEEETIPPPAIDPEIPLDEPEEQEEETDEWEI
jgi:hypothetical protein